MKNQKAKGIKVPHISCSPTITNLQYQISPINWGKQRAQKAKELGMYPFSRTQATKIQREDKIKDPFRRETQKQKLQQMRKQQVQKRWHQRQGLELGLPEHPHSEQQKRP